MKKVFLDNEYYQKKSRLLLLKEKKYMMGYDLCSRWLEEMKETNEKNSHNYWFCYYCLGVASWGLEKFELALDYFDITEEYTEQIRDIIKTRTMKAMCYVALESKDKALKEYDDSLEKCNALLDIIEVGSQEQKGILHCKASLLMNEGDLLEDTEMMLNSIGIYKYLLNEDELTNQILERKIQTGYNAIKKIYIKYNQQDKIDFLINKINSPFLRRKFLTSTSL